MSFENRHIFRGRINNISLGDLRIQPEHYEKESVEKRIEIIERILEEKGGFFEEYFDNHYKVELSQNDELSENNNVCRVLESYADYILSSKEVREERKQKGFKYRFYVDKLEFKRRVKKEESLEGTLENAKGKIDTNKVENDEKVIDFLLKTEKNNKLSKQQAIFEEDLNENSYCGEILRQYKSAIDDIYSKLEDIRICNKEKRKDENGKIIKSKYANKRHILTKVRKDLHYDMIQCKTQLKGSFGDRLRNQIKESTEPSWDCFDWHNPQHIKELLLLQYNFETQDDLSYMVMDLEDIITELKEVYYNGDGKKVNFSKQEIEVVDLIRRGYKITEIANIFGVKQPAISKVVRHIVEKILEYTLDNFKRDI